MAYILQGALHFASASVDVLMAKLAKKKKN